MSIPSASPAPGISDQERDEQIDALRRHAGDGRLSVDELEERIDRAYAARTREELDVVLAGLPAVADPGAQARQRVADKRPALAVADLAPYLSVNLLLITVWALSGAGFFWPIWPILGWGICVVSYAAHPRFGRPALRPACRDTTRTAAGGRSG